MEHDELARALGGIEGTLTGLVDRLDRREIEARQEAQVLDGLRIQTKALEMTAAQTRKDVAAMRPVIDRVKKLEMVLWALAGVIGAVAAAPEFIRTKAESVLKLMGGK